MKNKEIKKETWKNPTQSFIEEVDVIVKNGISQEDKEFLIDELEEMVEMLQEWKATNPEECWMRCRFKI